MSDCPKHFLDAYHDGELDASQRASVAQHLSSCADCRNYLAEIDQLSQLINSGPSPKLSQFSLHRLHSVIDRSTDLGLIRFASMLSGIAAGIIICGLAWTMHQTKTVEAAPAWITAAVVPESAVPAANSPVAQWYLADASVGQYRAEAELP